MDTVDHNILVARLQHLVGLCGSALEQWHSPVGDAAYLSESYFMQYCLFICGTLELVSGMTGMLFFNAVD